MRTPKGGGTTDRPPLLCRPAGARSYIAILTRGSAPLHPGLQLRRPLRGLSSIYGSPPWRPTRSAPFLGPSSSHLLCRWSLTVRFLKKVFHFSNRLCQVLDRLYIGTDSSATRFASLSSVAGLFTWGSARSSLLPGLYAVAHPALGDVDTALPKPSICDICVICGRLFLGLRLSRDGLQSRRSLRGLAGDKTIYQACRF